MPEETFPYYVLVAILGVSMLMASLFGSALRKTWLPAPLLFAAGGIAVGPKGLGLLELPPLPEMVGGLELGVRLTLGVSLMSAALSLPRGYFRRNWRSLAVILGPGMLMMWGFATLAVSWLLPLGLLQALLVGAILTPTDPVLATSVVTGRIAEDNVPRRLRSLLRSESAANDGLALLFVMIPVLLLTRPAPQAWSEWFTHSVLWQVLGSAAVGGVIGCLLGRLEAYCHQHKLVEKRAWMSVPLALTFVMIGVIPLLKGDGILAVFVAGLAFHFTGASAGLELERGETEDVAERFFQLPMFAVFGAILPWDEWTQLGWRGVALALLVLPLRRLPMIFLLKRALGSVRGWRECLFAGWFGPIGLAAFFYITIAQVEAGYEAAWPIGSLVIAVSILLHGLTSTPFAQWLGRHSAAES